MIGVPRKNRAANNPDRRVAPPGAVDDADVERFLSQLRYEGRATHKLHSGDYRFEPPANPGARKSVCDQKRAVNLAEAQALLKTGIRRGMLSKFTENGVPKDVWAVDEQGEVYEAKCDPLEVARNPGRRIGYHGYRLDREDSSWRYITDEWERRQ